MIPAVISVFLGDELNAVLEAIESDTPYDGVERRRMRLGVDSLPSFTRDTTDRNRTSPFAFTGNKFEFRMVGSSNSIACANIMLNSAVADVLKGFADELEGAEDFDAALHELIRRTIKEHKRVIFNGNGYDDKWIAEAESRGLLNLKTTPEAMQLLIDPENVRMLTEEGVFSETEIRSRYEIQLENYVKTVRIEANTMIDMVRKEILPAIAAYAKDTAETALSLRSLARTPNAEEELAAKLSELYREITEKTKELEANLTADSALKDARAQAEAARDTLLTVMASLRTLCDEAESVTAEKYWPYPTYAALLFGVE